MPQENEIHAFQTGRQYSPHGQRIAYAEIERVGPPDQERVKVGFADVDRMVYGVVLLFVASDRGVLHAYDHGFYNREGEYPEKYPELFDALKAAALTL